MSKRNESYKSLLTSPYAPKIPDNADGIYLYSPTQGKENPTLIDPCFKASPVSANVAFTTKIPFGPELQARMQAWEQQYRDGRIIGYHTPDTREFYFLG